MKLRKRLPWYYWIPVIGIFPFFFRKETDHDDLQDTDLSGTYWFEYQTILIVLIMIVLIWVIDNYVYLYNKISSI